MTMKLKMMWDRNARAAACLAGALMLVAPSSVSAQTCAQLRNEIANLTQALANDERALANCTSHLGTCTLGQTQSWERAIMLVEQEIAADRLRLATVCGPPQIAHLSLDGMEVTQAIQDMSNSVTLIAGKTTWVRVYLGTTGSARAVTARLEATRTGGGTTTISPSAHVTVDPSNTLEARRRDWTKTLNFQLPASVIAAGTVTFRLVSVANVGTGTVTISCVTCANTTLVHFLSQPPLVVRAVGLTYQFGTPSQSAAPSALDFALLRSWLGRAYPVASVTYSQTSTASTSTWPFDCTQADAQLAAIRASDISAGTDARTHYFGLVSNQGGYMRGCANGIPTTPDPATTASGPTGPTASGIRPINVTGDTDGSFGDWYGGHELGHTYGRFHPGFCNGNSADDPAFPYPSGQIGSGIATSYVGLDTGDRAHSIPLAVLWPTSSFDIMTYCNQPQWLSAYSYEGVRRRLLDENPGFHVMGVLAEAGVPPQAGPMVHVTATVNLTRGTGAIAYVTPVERAAQQPSVGERAALVVRDAAGRELSRTPVALRETTDIPEGEDKTALVDAAVPFDPVMAEIDLVVDDRVLAQYRNVATPPSAPSDLRLGTAANAPSDTAAPTAAGRTLTWAPAVNANGTVTYTVQISNDGNAWSTIAVGLTEPKVTLGPEHAGAKMARVIASSGFRSAPPVVIQLNP